MRRAKLAVCLGVVGMLGGMSWAQTQPAPTTIPTVTTQVPAPAKPDDEAAARKTWLAAALKEYHGPEYVRSEVMIPMRDGVHAAYRDPAAGGQRARGSAAAVSDGAHALWGGGVLRTWR